MRVLKTAIVSLVTTTVLLPLALVILAAWQMRGHGEFLMHVDARVLVMVFVSVFAALFVFTWFFLGRAARQRDSQ